MGDAFIMAIHELESDPEEGDHPIHLLINSSGGDWHDALAIYDAIQDCNAIVTCEVLGKAMSGAAVLAACCEQRWIHPNATVMVHDGTHGGEGDTRTFVQWGKAADRENKRMHALLAKHSNKSAAWWRNKCRYGDFIMSSSQAVELGLFDSLTRDEDV